MGWYVFYSLGSNGSSNLWEIYVNVCILLVEISSTLAKKYTIYFQNFPNLR